MIWALLGFLCMLRATASGKPVGSEAGRAHVPQFSSSIFLGGDWDYLPFNASTTRSRCTDMVDRVAEYTVGQVQFVPTFYWVDEGPLDPPVGFDPSCKGADLGSYYCYNRFNATRVQHWCYNRLDGECPPVDDTQIATLVEHVGACMKYAVGLGLDLHLNARVDDGRALGGWRNTLDFDPLEKYGNYSYLEAVVFPLADAARHALSHSTKVDFEMQGEMGATLFFHPQKWVEAAVLTRQRLLEGSPFSAQDNVQIGVHINNNKLCGCINIGITDSREYLGNFSAAFNRMQSEFDFDGLHELFLAIDFVGISAYIPMPTPWFEPCQLEDLMKRFDEEFGYYNLSLSYLASLGVEVQWTEFGVGGGDSPNGDRKASTAEEAAYYPWWGIWGEYKCEMDPWDLCHPDRPSPVRDYSRHYYNMTAQYLEQGGCDYNVRQVFIWGVNSWDIQAIYPLSSSEEGSYRDPVISDIINSHNKLANVLNAAIEEQEVEAAPAPVVVLTERN